MTQAQILERLMEYEWKHSADWGDPQYYAAVMGAKRTGDKGENGLEEWLFPDGSILWIGVDETRLPAEK